jgi:hypothetical protein
VPDRLRRLPPRMAAQRRARASGSTLDAGVTATETVAGIDLEQLAPGGTSTPSPGGPSATSSRSLEERRTPCCGSDAGT